MRSCLLYFSNSVSFRLRFLHLFFISLYKLLNSNVHINYVSVYTLHTDHTRQNIAKCCWHIIIIIIILLDLLARFRPRTKNELSEGDSDANQIFLYMILVSFIFT
jgi:hypothetical protein